LCKAVVDSSVRRVFDSLKYLWIWGFEGEGGIKIKEPLVLSI
jgi:hypothetical protein